MGIGNAIDLNLDRVLIQFGMSQFILPSVKCIREMFAKRLQSTCTCTQMKQCGWPHRGPA